MSDDISVFHRRMRKPAIIATVAGFSLGFLAVGAQWLQGEESPLWLAPVLGVLATAFLYGVMYRNLERRIEYERSQQGDGDEK